MPVKKCVLNGKDGWKWGDEGKCYTGNDAKKKALQQGIAIISSNPKSLPAEFERIKISYDYDNTLSTDKGKQMAKKSIDEGNVVYIISARNDKEGMLKVADDLGIPHSRVYATGSNKAKVEKVKELDISKHIDNNSDVIKELGDKGQKF